MGVATAATLGVALLATLVLLLPPPRVSTVTAHTVSFLAAAVGTIAFAKRRHDSQYAPVWRCLAAAGLLFAGAEASWVLSAMLPSGAGAVALANALHVAGYGFLAAAAIRATPERVHAFTWRLILDLVIVFVSLSALGWILVFQYAVQAPAPSLRTWLPLALPALDLTLLGFLLFMLRVARPVHQNRIVLFGLGLLLWTVVDVAQAIAAVRDGSQTGAAIEALSVGGYAALGMAAVVAPSRSTRAARDGHSWGNAVYVPVAILLPITVYDYVLAGALHPVLFAHGIALLAAMLGRQTLYTREILESSRSLEKTAAGLERAQAVAHVGSWEIDDATRHLELSAEARRIFGFSADEPVSHDSVMALVHPDDFKRVEDTFWDSVRQGTPIELSHRVIVDGAIKHLEHKGITLYNEQTPVRSIGTVQDVTELRRADERVRFQAHLLDNVRQSVVATDPEGRITYWGPGAQALYGWTPEEALGKDSTEVMPSPEGREAALAARDALQHGETWAGEIQVQNRHGRRFQVETTINPVYDAHGALSGFIGVAQDVTERTRMAWALQKRVKELRALSSIATVVATTDSLRSVVEVVVGALEPAFVHADTWVHVEVDNEVATSAGDPPDFEALGASIDGGVAGRIEVRYRSSHGVRTIGPFLQEEQNLLHAVADILASGARRMQALAMLEQRNEALLDAQRIARLGSWTWDPASDTATWSEMMYTIFERPPEAGPAGIEEALALFAPRSRVRLQRALEEAVASRGSYELDLEVVLPSGTKHVVSRGEAVREDGDLVLLRGTVQDITDRTRLEEDTRFQALLLGNIDEAVFANDLDGKVLYWNDAAERLFGWTPEEAVGRVVTDLLGAEQTQEPSLVEGDKGGLPHGGDYKLRRKDGAELTVRMTTSALLGKGGRLDGFIVICEDVTDEREVQKRYHDLVEYALDGILRTRVDGQLEFANPAAARMLGYGSVGEFLAAVPDVRELYVEEEDRAVVFGQVRLAKRPVVETRLRRRDGTEIPVEIRAQSHLDADGVEHIEASFHDLTDRLQAEQAERDRIENEHLKRLDKTLRDFINTAAHDLNQPLTPMKLALYELKESLEASDDATRRRLDMVARNVDRMVLLVQDLLDVARLEAGTLRLAPQMTPVGGLLGETKEFFDLSAAEKGVTLEAAVGGPDFDAFADGRRIIQVLFNLVGNALKFTPEGGRIQVTAVRSADQARVEVTDTGMGLTSEQMGRLFKPFSQVHAGMPNAPKGTGLGLYISRGIVQQHGGDMGVTSAGPGAGSTFWFTLPLQAPPKPSSEAAPASAPKEGASGH